MTSGTLRRVAPGLFAALLVVSGSAIASPVSAAATADPNQIPAYVRVIEAVKEHQRTHSEGGDYNGLNRAVVAAGGSPLVFDTNRGKMSAEQVEMAASIPPDAFFVSGSWSHVVDTFGTFLTYFGSWNFRNTYDTGGYPMDAMGINTSGVSGTCWFQQDSSGWAYKETGGSATSWISKRFVDFNSLVYNVDDHSGPAYVDRGTIYITYQWIHSCSPKYYYGMSYFEHNYQGCNCTWSVSINIGAMTISYSQSDPPNYSYQEAEGLYNIYV